MLVCVYTHGHWRCSVDKSGCFGRQEELHGTNRRGKSIWPYPTILRHTSASVDATITSTFCPVLGYETNAVGNSTSAAGTQQAQVFAMTPTAVTHSQTTQATPRDDMEVAKGLQTIVHQWQTAAALQMEAP
eukprot:252663-Amphidinium_carterae.1